MNRAFFLSLSLSLLLLPAGALTAKDKHSKKQQPASDQDQIEVAAHLPLTSGPVSRFVETQHYRRDYLYAEHENKTVSLIDVTSANEPSKIAEVAMPSGLRNTLVSVTGTAALVGSGDQRGDDPATPQTFRIMDLKDPARPKVTQEFEGVTAISRDEKRGLIFLANDDGIWILKQHYAVSPEDAAFQKEIEHTIYDTR